MLSRSSTLSATAGSWASSASAAPGSRCLQRRVSLPCTPFPRAALSYIPPVHMQWLEESYFGVDNAYERLATGNTHFALGIMTASAVVQHTGTVRSIADYVPVHGLMAGGRASGHSVGNQPSPGFAPFAVKPHFLGWRPKKATWPLNKKETVQTKVWG
ncbi:hypothetical protein SCUCBS95973_002652 [Sporothrix curviconia]|uniref:Uncharacterized protein n=1 Tax=Sporothrix curviconia TaxID=1260050 RepID=A0ABP0B926_9PEZI